MGFKLNRQRLLSELFLIFQDIDAIKRSNEAKASRHKATDDNEEQQDANDAKEPTEPTAIPTRHGHVHAEETAD